MLHFGQSQRMPTSINKNKGHRNIPVYSNIFHAPCMSLKLIYDSRISPLHIRSAGSGVQIPSTDIPSGDMQVALILPARIKPGLHLKTTSPLLCWCSQSYHSQGHGASYSWLEGESSLHATELKTACKFVCLVNKWGTIHVSTGGCPVAVAQWQSTGSLSQEHWVWFPVISDFSLTLKR